MLTNETDCKVLPKFSLLKSLRPWINRYKQ